MCDWEGCTIGTIRPPNPNQRGVAKTSGFPHPFYITGTPRGGSPVRESWRSGDEGITPMGHRWRQGITLFSVRIEFSRSTAAPATRGGYLSVGQQPTAR